MLTYIKKHPIISFVLINYIISWTFLYPCYQLILNAEEGTFPPLALIGLIGAYGPSIAAIIVEKINNGKKGVKGLLKKLLIWKVSFIWYLFLLLPILIYGLAALASHFGGFNLGAASYQEGVSAFILYIFLALPFGPMGEELGWRGYMLPKLLEKNSLLKSSLIIGVVWTVWHLASFTFPGAAIPSIFEVNLWSFLLYLLTISSISFLFSYLWVNTNGSVLLAILFHGAFNANTNIVLTFLPEITENVAQRTWIYGVNILFTVVVTLVLWKFNRPIIQSN